MVQDRAVTDLEERRKRVANDMCDVMAKLNKLLEQSHALDLMVDISVDNVRTLDRFTGRKIVTFSVYKVLARGGALTEGV